MVVGPDVEGTKMLNLAEVGRPTAVAFRVAWSIFVLLAHMAPLAFACCALGLFEPTTADYGALWAVALETVYVATAKHSNHLSLRSDHRHCGLLKLWLDIGNRLLDHGARLRLVRNLLHDRLVVSWLDYSLLLGLMWIQLGSGVLRRRLLIVEERLLILRLARDTFTNLYVNNRLLFVHNN